LILLPSLNFETCIVMDLGLSAASSAATKVAGKGGKRARASNAGRDSSTVELEVLQQAVVNIGKLSLKSNQSIEALQATVMITFLLPAKTSIIQESKQMVEKYMAAAESFQGEQEDRDAQLGIPSAHILNLWITEAVKFWSAKPEAASKEKAAQLQAVLAPFANDTQAARTYLGTACGHFMITQPYNKAMRKVEVGLDAKMREVFLSLIMPMVMNIKGFRKLSGKPPRGQLVREIQQFLDMAKGEEEE